MNLKDILEEAIILEKNQKLLNSQNGGDFNIFEIANISTKEVKICRLLQDLLSPSGSHCQGSTYLKIFAEDVLDIEVSENELDNAYVHREYIISNNRRIDLVIKIGDKVIPIEVKIHAKDSESQCFDYAQIAEESKLYYLTLFGEPPEAHSKSGTSANNKNEIKITNISFSYDILHWLEKCLHSNNTLNKKPISEIILQLQTSIKKLTNQEEGEIKMELQKIISKSSETMRTSEKVIDSINTAKFNKMLEVFNEIEKRIKNDLKLLKLNDKEDYAFDNNQLIKDFYERNSTTKPGISYKYKSVQEKNVDICLRIEIHQRIYFEYSKVDNGEVRNETLIGSSSDLCHNNKKSIESKWEYLPYNDGNRSPNFRHSNDAFYELFDDSKFNIFIDEILRRLKIFYNNDV